MSQIAAASQSALCRNVHPAFQIACSSTEPRLRSRLRPSGTACFAQQHALQPRQHPVASSVSRHNRHTLTCRALDEQDEHAEDVQVVLEGDLVYVHFECYDENGELIESTRADDGEPITFEVGAGELFANEMIKAMDAAVRGLAIGDKARVEAQGNDWKRELLFEVPRDHPEVQRLEGRYKNVGGLAPDLVVELVNGSRAVVLSLSEESVQLDANSMLAGKKLVFEIELVNIEASS